jgi:hypothetical protein
VEVSSKFREYLHVPLRLLGLTDEAAQFGKKLIEFKVGCYVVPHVLTMLSCRPNITISGIIMKQMKQWNKWCAFERYVEMLTPL